MQVDFIPTFTLICSLALRLCIRSLPSQGCMHAHMLKQDHRYALSVFLCTISRFTTMILKCIAVSFASSRSFHSGARLLYRDAQCTRVQFLIFPSISFCLFLWLLAAVHLCRLRVIYFARLTAT